MYGAGRLCLKPSLYVFRSMYPRIWTRVFSPRSIDSFVHLMVLNNPVTKICFVAFERSGDKMKNDFIEKRIENPFADGDGGDLGTKEHPSIWLFGIEHGIPPKTQIEIKDNPYSIKTQLEFPYNRNSFKLLAAILDKNCVPGREFANEFAVRRKPFVKNEKGFFKGNLFSYPCKNVSEWDDDAEKITGFKNKNEYYDRFREVVFPSIQKKIIEHEPKIFIGVGITHKRDYSKAVINESEAKLLHKAFDINKRTKNVFYNIENKTKLFIIPHLSGGPGGLNSHESLFKVGRFIRETLNLE